LRNLDKRKIQKVGVSTLSVTLPKEWTSLADVKQGDTVYVDQSKNNSLIILSDKLLAEEENLKNFYINCDLISESKLLARLIVGSYMQGAEFIRVTSLNRIEGNQIDKIRDISKKLVGLSIIEESSKEIVLECLIDPTKFSINSLLRRLSTITSTMLDEVLVALIELNLDLATDVVNREDAANGVYWLITRLSNLSQNSQIFADKIGLEMKMNPSFRLISMNLERVADCSKNVAKIVFDLRSMGDHLDNNELKELSSLNQLTKEIFQKAINSFFLRDLIVANEVINLRDTLIAETQLKRNGATLPYFRAVTIMLNMIAEYSSSIAGETININVSQSNYLPPQT